MNLAIFRAALSLLLLRPGISTKDKASLKWALADNSMLSNVLAKLKKQHADIVGFDPANIIALLQGLLALLPQIIAIINLFKNPPAPAAKKSK